MREERSRQITSAEPNDEAIIQRVLQGQPALFEVILRRHNQRLYRLLRAILNDDHDAEDALQETYIRAYQHLAQFQGRARFGTWLARIAINEARARIRRRRRQAIEANAMHVEAAPDPATPPPERRAVVSELSGLAARAIESLPRQMRVVFVLREIEGLETADTADMLGLTPANVKVRLHRARRQLRETLQQALGQELDNLYAFAGERCAHFSEVVLHRMATLPHPSDN